MRSIALRFIFSGFSFVALCLHAQTPCIDGFAGAYPCENVDFWARLSTDAMGGANNLNDIWGWTHPASGREFALVGKNNGTAFVEVTDPGQPVYLGTLPTHTINSLWRDIKVYSDHAFIVAEASGHGMQVFDLNRLIEVDEAPVTFDEDAHYDLFGRAHNIVINEESGFAYAVGSDTFSGGLHIVNIQSPLEPVIAGDFAQDGYTHDAQAVMYHGPDQRYCGKEIVFAANENSLTIVDVNDKLDAVLLAALGYEGSAYAHQCWLTEDHRFVLLGDELDELQGLTEFTRTFIFDVQDLEAPVLIGVHEGTNTAIDHNLYIRWNQVYQSNYRSGLRILNSGRVAEGALNEVGYFDVQPIDNNPSFSGTWSNYCYFNSGTVVLTDMTDGLFIVKPRIATAKELLTSFANEAVAHGEIYLSYIPEDYTALFSDLPVGVSASTGTSSFPGIHDYTLDGVADLAPGEYTFTLTIEHDGQETVLDITLTREDVQADGIYLLTPADGEMGELGEEPEFEWTSLPEDLTYTFTLSETADFSSVLFSTVTEAQSIGWPVAAEPGVYFWQVSALGACGAEYVSDLFSYEIEEEEEVISVNELNGHAFSLFPNPLHERLTVTSELQEQFFVSMHDMTGASVGHQTSGWMQNGSLTLNTAHLAPGVYVVRISNGLAFRVIKAH